MSTYLLCKRVIERETYKSKDDMLSNLDIFLLNNRINQDQYNELLELLDTK